MMGSWPLVTGQPWEPPYGHARVDHPLDPRNGARPPGRQEPVRAHRRGAAGEPLTAGAAPEGGGGTLPSSRSLCPEAPGRRDRVRPVGSGLGERAAGSAGPVRGAAAGRPGAARVARLRDPDPDRRRHLDVNRPERPRPETPPLPAEWRGRVLDRGPGWPHLRPPGPPGCAPRGARGAGRIAPRGPP